MPTHTQEIHAQEAHLKAARTTFPDGFSPENVKNLSIVLNALLADVFALYLKTKNFAQGLKAAMILRCLWHD